MRHSGIRNGIEARNPYLLISNQPLTVAEQKRLRSENELSAKLVELRKQGWTIVATVRAIPGTDEHPPHLGISEGGWHAAEGLVLARYFMFTQVYFHKTRVAFEVHLCRALQALLPGGLFPKPNSQGLKEYLPWDDWKVLGHLANGQGEVAAMRFHRMLDHGNETQAMEAGF